MKGETDSLLRGTYSGGHIVVELHVLVHIVAFVLTVATDAVGVRTGVLASDSLGVLSLSFQLSEFEVRFSNEHSPVALASFPGLHPAFIACSTKRREGLVSFIMCRDVG